MTDQSPSSGITVVGGGEVFARPDLATVVLGVSVLGDSVAGATAAAREGAEAVLAALEGSGVSSEDVTTTTYSVFPEYDHHEGTQRLIGFRVTNQQRVRVRDVSRVGEVIDRCAEAAGDAATVDSVTFSVEDESALSGRARELAWSDAQVKAEHLATLAGRSLGPVVSVVESATRPPGPFPMARLAAMAESTPIETGTTTVAVTLVVRFELA